MSKEIRHFLDLNEIPADTLKGILKHAHVMKRSKFNPPQIFAGLSLAMIFDKLSTRTRFSFDVAMKQLGGHTVTATMAEMQIGGKESVESTAKVLSRYVDAIMIRTSDPETLRGLADNASIPIINGMTDDAHPCQIMADIMTIEERFGDVQGKKIAWYGDVNNVSKTFERAAPIWDFEFIVSGPATGIDPLEAAVGADVIVTDTWVSLGQEGKKTEQFKPYQVTADVMKAANNGAIFMHCLPISEWNEVTQEVATSPASVIYDEAENRLHVQKAILAWCFEHSGVKI